MAKRGATTELNHDNWNDEDESEEAGVFRQASAEALQTRVIKQARRKLGSHTEVLMSISTFKKQQRPIHFKVNHLVHLINVKFEFLT